MERLSECKLAVAIEEKIRTTKGERAVFGYFEASKLMESWLLREVHYPYESIQQMCLTAYLAGSDSKKD